MKVLLIVIFMASYCGKQPPKAAEPFDVTFVSLAKNKNFKKPQPIRLSNKFCREVSGRLECKKKSFK